MDTIPNSSANDWAIPDDSGFQEIRERFKKNRKKKRRRTLLALILISLLAWIPIVVSFTYQRVPMRHLTFEEDRLETIIPQIETLYNIEIQIDNEKLKKLRFSGTFRQKQPEKILNILSRSLKFTYTQSDAQRYIIDRR